MGEPSQPLVSVIIPTSERLESCQRAILSVEAQTYRNHETIVVEDGSNSGIDCWLGASGFPSVRHMSHPTRRGLPAARNTGLAAARGEYVAFLDDDDQWEPEKLERQMAAAESNPGVKLLVTCGALVRAESGEILGINHPRLEGNLRDSIRRRGLYSVPSSLVLRRADAIDMGGFDEAVRSHVDHDFILTMAKAGFSALPVDEPLVRAWESEGPRMTTDPDVRIEALGELLDKWLPELRAWYGEGFCAEFARNHYARVGASLMADQLRHRMLREAVHTFRKAAGGRSDPRLAALIGLKTARLMLSRSPLGWAWRHLRLDQA